MSDEIERKFLVGDNAGVILESLKRTAYKVCDIVQSYDRTVVSTDDEPKEVRIRKISEQDENQVSHSRYKRTMKIGSGLHRKEFECELSEAEYNEYDLSSMDTLNKTRYFVDYCGREMSIDYLHLQDKPDMVYLEVEFASIEDAKRFRPDDWMGTEVTGNKVHSMRELARLV